MKKYCLRYKCSLVVLKRAICLAALIPGLMTPAAFSQSFTIQQALSAPFAENLVAAPALGRMAWVANIDGRRNIWVAEPEAKGNRYASHQLTHYSQDDGQKLNVLLWTPDASSIIYVRGERALGPNHPSPNPAWFPLGARQQIWEVRVGGGEPRLIAEGYSPALSPNGKVLAYLAGGQIWTVSLDTTDAKPQQILQMRGSTSSLRWSPDGTRLAFVSYRGDHSYIVVYSVVDKSLHYIDPSTDLDMDFVWSPDSERIAFLRIPSVKGLIPFAAHRTGPPWSIRVEDVATGHSREVWRAADGVGSVYHETESQDQLHWVAGDRLIFHWERDGWLHLYAVPLTGGAAQLLTPGRFEVDHVNLSFDRKTLVFDSNQDDIDRLHVWTLRFTGSGSTGLPQAVTGGTGIETQPVVASDNTSVAVLRSDAYLPTRAAIVRDGQLVDLAPKSIPSDFPGRRFVEPRQVIFPAADGLAIHGQLFLPPGLKAGERHPAVVFFHGGSRRQMLLGWNWIEYYSQAYAMNQYLASRGYVVLSVNYRGGTGYGLDFREALNYGPTGASEFNDVIGAGLYLKSRGDVDGKRIACWGGSYGGLLTGLALARTSDLYAAGVDLSGVYDWNDILRDILPKYDPLANPKESQLAFLSSPAASISTWRSPVLLIQGDEDRNVPFSETVQLVEALRKRNVDVEEMVFPDGAHEILLRRHWLRVYGAMADFFDRTLNKKQ